MALRLLAALAALAPAAALAETAPPGAPPAGTPSAEVPMTREEFRAFAEGWTLHFEEGGVPFGAETYLPGGEVIWKPEGGLCEYGVWSESRGRICFLYDLQLACWRLYRDGQGVLARSADGTGTEVRVSRRDRLPLACGDEPAV